MKQETLKKAKKLEHDISEYSDLLRSRNADYHTMLIKITCAYSNVHTDYHGRVSKEVWNKMLDVVADERLKTSRELEALTDDSADGMTTDAATKNGTDAVDPSVAAMAASFELDKPHKDSWTGKFVRSMERLTSWMLYSMRNYKRIFRPGTLFRVAGTNAVFMSLGLNPKDNRQIFSFNGMDIVRRCAVKRADGRAVPATRREQQTYWAVLREVIAQREETPKFAPGDWITEISTGRYDLVESYSNGYYACENSGFPKHHQVGYRRWNINDARPGNILFYHPTRMAFIFKGIEGDDRKLKLFCSCNTEAPEQPGAFQLYDEDEYFGRADDLGIIPANNKQRRTMFTKMQSEGYELKPCPDGRLVLTKTRNGQKED